jgi:hypothetical protein
MYRRHLRDPAARLPDRRNSRRERDVRRRPRDRQRAASPQPAAIGLLGGGIASVPDDGNFVFVVAQVDGTVARVDALVAGGATDSTRPSDGLVVLAGRAPSAIRDPTMALTATTTGGTTRTVTWGGPGTDWADCAPQNATTG